MTSRQNLRGIVFMLLSMVAFALADTCVKLASAFMTPPQVMFYLMLGGLVMFTLLTFTEREPFFNRNAFAPVVMVRYLAELVGMVGMIMALSKVPLSIVGAITQAAPILVAVGAALFLGEVVSWRRWTSICIGFLGVLIIVQPGAEGFDLSVLWAVLAMLGLALRDLTTRIIPKDIGSASLATYTMLVSVPFSIGWTWLQGDTLFPPNINWAIILPMTTLGAIGYVLLIKSIRMAEVSVVTPFRYSRIIFLILLGVVVFGERPGISVLSGAALVIASGIYIVWRERKAADTR
ncbi:MAG: DMT family transporter [Pseudomonadota bacterium]